MIDVSCEDERYVRLYCASPAAWLLLSWQAQALYPLIRRCFDRAGVLPLGGLTPQDGIRVLLPGWPGDVVDFGVTELLRRGWFEHYPDGLDGSGCLFDPEFEETETCGSSDKERQRAYRARRKDRARARALRDARDGEEVTQSEKASRTVTNCHLCSVQPSPTLCKPTPSRPERASARDPGLAAGSRDEWLVAVSRAATAARGRSVPLGALEQAELQRWRERGIPLGIVLDVIGDLVTPEIQKPIGYIRREVAARAAVLRLSTDYASTEPPPIPEPIETPAWNEIRSALRRSMSGEFETWISPLVPLGEDPPGTVVLAAPNGHYVHALRVNGWIDDEARRFGRSVALIDWEELSS